MLNFKRSWIKTPSKNTMKFLIIILSLIFSTLLAGSAYAADNAMNVTIPEKGQATLIEETSIMSVGNHVGPGKKKNKYGGYDKKAAKNRAKGSKCGDRRNSRVRGR